MKKSTANELATAVKSATDGTAPADNPPPTQQSSTSAERNTKANYTTSYLPPPSSFFHSPETPSSQ